MKITQIPMGTHNAQLTCYLQDPCTEMPALDRCCLLYTSRCV